jgi:hypothetical protein
MTVGAPTNPTIRIKVNVIELDDRDRLVARVTFSSGSEGDIPIDVQDDLWKAATDHGYSRDQIVYGAGAWELLQQLPDSR